MTELSNDIRRASKSLTKLEKASTTWDFKSFDRICADFEREMSGLATSWQSSLSEKKKEVDNERRRLESRSYRQMLEEALREAELPLEGEFPEYDVSPFRLEVDIENEVVRLRCGRRVEKMTALAPAALAQWVQKRYTKMVARRFNSERFFKDLLSAYRFANRLVYSKAKGQELWGRPVALQLLYELLTLRGEGRRDYPKEQFIYDLARLREAGLSFGEYTIEFGSVHGEESRAFLVRDVTTGREDRFSSLTIYRKED